MADVLVNSFLGRLVGDNAQIGTAIDLEADTIKLMLLDSNHTNDIDAHVFIDNVSANEVSASGSYPAGGVTLTPASTTDDTNDLGQWDVDDVSITSATITASSAAIYKDTGTPGTSPVIGIWDCVVSSTSGTITITIDANGLIQISTS